MAEYWDIYDRYRKPKGRLHRRGDQLKPGEYHLVAEAWIVTPDKQLLMTKRHPDKSYGNMWECTGGAVVAGEDSLTGIKREIKEEVGIIANENQLEFIGTISGSSFFTDIYSLMVAVELNSLSLQPEEVIDAKLVNYSEFVEMSDEGLIIPHLVENMKQFKYEFWQ